MKTFEIGELPYGIYRFLLRNNRRVGNQARENNHYWVSDICKCLRQSYYEISNIPYDAERKEENEAELLWSLQSAKYLHNLTNRILRLYLSVRVMRSPPQPERSVACDYCRFKKRCDLDG